MQQSAGASCSAVPPLLKPAFCTMEHNKVLALYFYLPKELGRRSHGICDRDLEGMSEKGRGQSNDDAESICPRCSIVALQHQDHEEHHSPPSYSQTYDVFIFHCSVLLGKSSN